MKNRDGFGFLIVLFIGMILTSGCMIPLSTRTIPVTPTTPQVVYETLPVSPTLIPALDGPAKTDLTAPATIQIVNETLPVSPARTPEPLVTTATNNGYDESKDNNRNTPLFAENESTGGLFINIRAGGSVEGLKVFIAREGTNVSPIEYQYLMDRTVVEGENKGYLQAKIPPDGHSALIKLQPGNYTAYLPDWNGGEPEQQVFIIQEDVITPIWFQGFSASSGGGCGC